MRGISKKRYLTIIKRLRYTDLVIEDFTRGVKNWGKAGLDYGIFGMVCTLCTDFRGFGRDEQLLDNEFPRFAGSLEFLRERS